MNKALADLKPALLAGYAELTYPAAPQLLQGVREAQLDQLLAYLGLLSRWAKTYNLTAVRAPEEMLRLHLLDSLAVRAPLLAYLQTEHQAALINRKVTLLDVGSGAGLPGVVLAATLPDLQVCCVDAVAKKTAFIRQAAAELALRNLRAEHARVEQLQGRTWTVITSRAFASLADFIRLSEHLLEPGGAWLAMKGRMPDEEISQLPAGVEVFKVEALLVPGLEAQRCLVWLQKKA